MIPGKYLLLAMAGTAGFAGSANAAWHEATSTHFTIYADEHPDRLREFAIRLEKFDKAVRHARSMPDHPPGIGNRLTVFVLSNVDQVQKLHRAKDQDIAGFYTPRATGSIAFVPRKAGSGAKTDVDPEIVFFHEYAHHLMMQDLDRPYPEWMIEGFAEFMSTAIFPKDGSVGLGAPALHRTYSLFAPTQMPLDRLLGGNYGQLSKEQRASLYARGWLLAHYLTFEPSRQGQLGTYLNAIAKGGDALEAARTAFGELKQLDRDLEKYLRRRKLTYLAVAPSVLTIGPVTIKPLTPGAAAIMPLRMQSKRGVNAQTAGPLADQIRAVAARYPDDPLVQVTLAEAEVDAGHHQAATAAADRALKADPKSTEAMIYMGRAAIARAETDQGTDADWKEARRWLMAANKIDTEDPEPLMLFYQTYLRQGERPTANAIAALHYASKLSPQDGGLRMTSAMQYLRDGKPEAARLTMSPIAYNPHGGGFSTAARRIIELIGKGEIKAALATRPPADEADDK